MKRSLDYKEKFKSFRNKTLYDKLESSQQAYIKKLSIDYHFTFQEFRQVVEACRDLSMWGENDLEIWWQEQVNRRPYSKPGDKKNILLQLQYFLDQLRRQEKRYPDSGLFNPKKRKSHTIITEDNDKKIFGMCPVASDKTICCNLRTIDAVENCLYGCSYCTIQTFYGKDILIQKDLSTKLNEIPIDPDRFYHFGTGQSSDSLAWGNLYRILDAHCQFAANHPNILMEFKTKSDNIKYFLKNDTPDNIVCSWSLNTPVIIKNEEHFTASLDQRLKAARAVADKNVKVAFHFHPLILYKDWATDYTNIVDDIIKNFKPNEVLFVSFGSVTLIKPVIQKIRALGNPTKTLQMQLVSDPHGKLTYPDDVKIKMFRQMYETFKPWREKVFFYLCMEKESIWKSSFGYVYDSNENFEHTFGQYTMNKTKSL
jgi:spore photoproduct lyase